MNKIFLLAICFVVAVSAGAQVQNPVNWTFSQKKMNNNTYEVHLTATIASGWHTYSQTTPDGGPVATEITWTKNPLLTQNGTTRELGKLEQHHEDLFGVDVKQYSNRVDFVQTLTVRGKVKTTASGTITFMVCNDHECLPPRTIMFSVPLK